MPCSLPVFPIQILLHECQPPRSQRARWALSVVNVDGGERSGDTLVLATGFETTKFASVIDFVGRGGTKLADAWSDVKPGAEAAYDETLHANIARVEPWQAGCSNYYRAPSGRVVTQWPGRMSELRQLLETPDWGDYEAGRFIPGDA